MAVANHQSSPLVVALIGKGAHVSINLGVEGVSQHAACSLGHDRIHAAR